MLPLSGILPRVTQRPFSLCSCDYNVSLLLCAQRPLVPHTASSQDPGSPVRPFRDSTQRCSSEAVCVRHAWFVSVWLGSLSLSCQHCPAGAVTPTRRGAHSLPQKPGAWESSAFLTMHFVIVASLCDGLLIHLCFSVFSSSASFSIVYLQKSFPALSLMSKEWKLCVAFHRSAVIGNKTSKPKSWCFISKQKAERAHVLGSCGRNKEHLNFKGGKKTWFHVWNLQLTCCLILAKSFSLSDVKLLYLWNREDSASSMRWEHKTIFASSVL